MSGLYTIPLSGLKDVHRTYRFELGEGFFEQFEGSEIHEGDLTADVDLDKRSTHIDLRFRISGKVKISCDRCLDMFMHNIDCDNRLLIKLGRKWEDNDPDLLTIPFDLHELEIKQYLYEFIHLALPLKRIHPDDENGNSTCNPGMLKKLEDHITEESSETDPRWDELKKLMDNN